MGRLIDGDALMEASKYEFWQDGSAITPIGEYILGKFRQLIRNMPTVTPEPKWIPCVDGNEPKANAECWISTSAKYVRRASYAPKANNQPNGFIVTDGGFGFYEYGKSAKAWMPYTKEPEPYREEGD